MTQSITEIIARAMQESRAWPAVYGAGTAEELTRAALTALEAAGYAIVPRDPTIAMEQAGSRNAGLEAQWHCSVSDVYRAMINTGREGA